MELSTDRLEGASRTTQERPFSTTAEERKRRAPRRSKDESGPEEAENLAEEQESHQLDDIA
ncbi:MAG: hypothetical protein WCC92_20170 [Candidatus Korobacteraceae bacterium]